MKRITSIMSLLLAVTLTFTACESANALKQASDDQGEQTSSESTSTEEVQSEEVSSEVIKAVSSVAASSKEGVNSKVVSSEGTSGTDIFVISINGNVPHGNIKNPTVSEFSGFGVHKIDIISKDEHGNVTIKITLTGKENIVNVFKKVVDLMKLSKDNPKPSFDYSSYLAEGKLENWKEPPINEQIITVGGGKVQDREINIGLIKKQNVFEKIHTLHDFPEINVESIKVYQSSLDEKPYYLKITLKKSGAEELEKAIELLNKRADIEFSNPNFIVTIQ